MIEAFASLFFTAVFADSFGMARAAVNCSLENKTYCEDMYILRAWMPQEGISTWAVAGRAMVYFLGLMYLFLGTSIIADRFMAAIECITSKEKSVKVRRVTGEEYTILVRVWNETVSNLTLMALGSSAPEILLSVIEIIGNGFEAGALGPGTIVGSAAFNLFIIIAICVGVIPSSEVRRIKHVGVFWVTAIWSVFAYLWLYLIIAQFTLDFSKDLTIVPTRSRWRRVTRFLVDHCLWTCPGKVTLFEGLLTFAFFPLTVLTAYCADRRLFGVFGHRYRSSSMKFRRSTTKKSPAAVNGDLELENGDATMTNNPQLNDQVAASMTEDEALFEDHRQQYIKIFKNLRSEHPDAPIELLERMAEQELLKKGRKSRAFYRIKATRSLIGAGNPVNKRIHEIEAEKRKIEEELDKAGAFGPNKLINHTNVSVSFCPGHYTCMEDVGTVYATVRCIRNAVQGPPVVVMVDYKTQDGTAMAISDYTPIQGTLTFNPKEESKTIGIDIVDNDIYEDDETFSIVLSNIRAYHENHHDREYPAALEAPSVATIMIVDNDHCGAFGFEHEKFTVTEAQGEIRVTVIRSRGARGEVRIPYHTVDGTAKGGLDYIPVHGTLIFKDEESEAEIIVYIVNDDCYEKSEDFSIILEEPEWEMNPDLKGEDKETAEKGRPILSSIPRAKIIIKESMEFKNFVDKMLAKTNANVMVGSTSWKQQFQEAISVEGGADADDEIEDKPKCFDYFMHAVTIPWKLLFALVPPTDYAGGWLTFVVSIVLIGVMTMLIGEFATHFGCTIGLKDAVTSISIVALGTSLPDTFASKSAATNDEHADSSIVNVTGSNAVNVYLGIGLAWAIAAIYHEINDSTFYVNTGSLAFSVTLFVCGAIMCIILLHSRRYIAGVKGELGGDMKWKVITICVFIGTWFTYLILSSLEAYCFIAGF